MDKDSAVRPSIDPDAGQQMDTKEHAASAASVPGTPGGAGITPQIIAVIDAACSEFLGKPVRILSVKVLSASVHESNPWGGQGRNIIHGSHNMVRPGH